MEKSVDFYNKKGFKRLVNTIFFSFAGFKAAWVNEEAFRQEVIIFLLVVPLAIWLGENNIEILLLISTVILVLVVELINTAIETVVDRVGVEYHELAGRAKDIGSAAVMLSILMAIMTWVLIII